jgi:hypothetical protein
VEHGTELLVDAVAEALSGHRCVSAWLGYGNALFLGFGVQTLPPRNSEGRRTVPPYELQTSMAGWRVGGLIAASSDGEREPTERAVAELIGRQVVCWRLNDRRGLQVEFADGCLLEVAPAFEVDPAFPDLDEWWFCLPGSRYVGVGGGGQVVAGHSGS